MAPPGHARRLLLAATVCAAAALALSPGAHAQFPNLWGPAPPPPDPWAPENRGSTPSGSGTANSNCPTVWQVLQSQPNLESTRTSLASAGLVAALNDSSFAGTLLAPVDQAWGTTPQWWWNPPYVLTVLAYHVLPGTAWTTGNLVGKTLPTAAPPTTGTLTFNWQWVPTGWASGSWVVGIQGATNTANIVTSNLAACNQGMVQTISSVLLPAVTPAASPPPPPPPPPSPVVSPSGCATVYAVLAATPSLSLLKQYVDQVAFSGSLTLAALLNNPQTQGTLLAPNNQAFQFASAWWASNPYQLAQVLTYHFLPGAGRTQLNLVTPPWQQFATASNVGGSLTASTAYGPAGGPVIVRGTSNSARIMAPDVPTCAGSYVHIVDTVLVPFR